MVEESNLWLPQQRIGEAVRSRRSDAGLTSYDLGRRAGVSHTTVLRVERGENTNIDSVLRVLRALKLSLADLVEGAPTPIPDDILPGWSALTDGERRHVRGLVAAIAATRARPRQLRVAEDGPRYGTDTRPTEGL